MVRRETTANADGSVCVSGRRESFHWTWDDDIDTRKGTALFFLLNFFSLLLRIVLLFQSRSFPQISLFSTEHCSFLF